MRDYTLGNFIASLREAHGFSQFQLGRLVGVTDKAVSKWENGATRPRMKTCTRLAAIFGISVDDLLSCQKGDGPMYRTTDGFDEEALWKQAHERLYELYGPVPPMQFVCRLDSEEIAFKGKGIIRLVAMIGYLNDLARQESGMVRSRDIYMSTLIAWLFGATDVNPLKPHWYCRKCHSVHFGQRLSDGWDLPEHRCNCGEVMVRDGHDIPFEGAQNYYIRNAISVSIDVPSAITDTIVKAVTDYYGDSSTV